MGNRLWFNWCNSRLPKNKTCVVAILIVTTPDIYAATVTWYTSVRETMQLNFKAPLKSPYQRRTSISCACFTLFEIKCHSFKDSSFNISFQPNFSQHTIWNKTFKRKINELIRPRGWDIDAIKLKSCLFVGHGQIKATKFWNVKVISLCFSHISPNTLVIIGLWLISPLIIYSNSDKFDWNFQRLNES